VVSPILRYFNTAHLPIGPEQEVTATYSELAIWVETNLLDGPEKSTALRKLLESRDAACRAALDGMRGND
jgi:hypothetical protein